MKKVFAELKGLRGWIVLAIVGVAMGTMSDLVLPLLFSQIVDYIESSGSVNVEAYIQATGIKMLIVVSLTILGAIIANYGASKVGSGLSRDLRSQLFTKVQGFTQEEFSKFGTASLITRNTNDVTNIQRFTVMAIRISTRAPIIMIGGIIMAYGKNPSLAAPLLIAVPMILLIITIISRKIIPMFSKIQDKLDAVNRVLREQISGVRVIRAFGTEKHEEERFDDVSEDFRKMNLRMIRLMSLMYPLLSIVLNITVVSILVLATRNIVTGRYIAQGDLVAIVQYVVQILFAFIMFSMMFIMYPRAEASARRIYEVIETDPAIVDLKQTITPDKDVKGTMEFRNVSFCFPDAEFPTLEGVSFKVEQGETLGIIGGTGSGKTTLLQLMLRFYDVTQGMVLVDDVDIRQMNQKDLRQRIGYVPQRWQLFSGDIADNFRFGKDDATLEEMEVAAEISQSYGFIHEKEDGFNSYVAQDGTNFSGGQKQRLSIGRAIIKNPEIYLFDDSFSALDAKTDATLRQDLEEHTKGATKIIVAQRIASIAKADQIIVLDKGNIVGRGTHSELLETCSIYKEIAESQFSEEVAS